MHKLEPVFYLVLLHFLDDNCIFVIIKPHLHIATGKLRIYPTHNGMRISSTRSTTSGFSRRWNRGHAAQYLVQSIMNAPPSLVVLLRWFGSKELSKQRARRRRRVWWCVDVWFNFAPLQGEGIVSLGKC